MRFTKVPKYLGWLAAALLIYVILSYLATRSLYYPFKYPQGQWQLQASLGAEDVWITTTDRVKVHGWWIASPNGLVTTLHLHGNGGNITHRALHAREIVGAGSSLLLLDYRGYGRSDGRPTEHGLYLDAEAAYDYLISKGVAPERLVIHGESLGSAMAVDLAARKRCGGLILEAPFTSAQAVAGRVLPVLGPWLVWGFDSKSKIAQVRVPLLVIHGDRDEIIDYDLGRELFDAASEPKQFWTVQGGGHNDLLYAAGGAYGARLNQFYRSIAQ